MVFDRGALHDLGPFCVVESPQSGEVSNARPEACVRDLYQSRDWGWALGPGAALAKMATEVGAPHTGGENAVIGRGIKIVGESVPAVRQTGLFLENPFWDMDYVCDHHWELGLQTRPCLAVETSSGRDGSCSCSSSSSYASRVGQNLARGRVILTVADGASKGAEKTLPS